MLHVQLSTTATLKSLKHRHGRRQAALQLLSLDRRPTAIFAASDMQAIGVLEAGPEFKRSRRFVRHRLRWHRGIRTA